MRIEKYFQRMDDIKNQMETVIKYSPEWMALEDQRTRISAKIFQRVGYKALNESIRVNAGKHIEGTCL